MNLHRTLLLLVCLLLPGIASGQSLCGPDGCPVPGQSAVAGRPSAKHPAVVHIISTRGDRQKHGSGTLVDVGDGSGLVVTAAHILGSDYDIQVSFPGVSGNYRSRATIVATDALHDCALLAVVSPAGIKGMPLAKAYAKQGERLTWAGYGGNQGYAIGTAIVAGYEHDWLVARGVVREGDSGGPLYTAGGLVGVVCEITQDRGRPWHIRGPQILWIRRFIERFRARRAPPPLVAVTPPPKVEPEVKPKGEPKEPTSTLAAEVRSILDRLDAVEKAKAIAKKAVPAAEIVGRVIASGAPAAAARWAPWLLPALAGASTGPIGWAVLAGGLALRRRWRKRKAGPTVPSMPGDIPVPPVKPPAPENDRPPEGTEHDFPGHLPRDNTEAEQLLQLSRLERRDPVHDALVGRLTFDKLDTLIGKGGSEAEWARELKRYLEDRFNDIVPLAETVTQGV